MVPKRTFAVMLGKSQPIVFGTGNIGISAHNDVVWHSFLRRHNLGNCAFMSFYQNKIVCVLIRVHFLCVLIRVCFVCVLIRVRLCVFPHLRINCLG